MRLGIHMPQQGGFAAQVSRPWPEELPVILETPETGTERDRENLEKLKSLPPAG